MQKASMREGEGCLDSTSASQSRQTPSPAKKPSFYYVDIE